MVIATAMTVAAPCGLTLGEKRHVKRISKLFARGAVVALASTVAGPIPFSQLNTIMIRVAGLLPNQVGELKSRRYFDASLFVTRIGYMEQSDDRRVQTPFSGSSPTGRGDAGFLVNTGKHLVLVARGAARGSRGKSRSFGGQPASLRLRIRKGQPRFFVTHLHSDHIGGLTSKDGKRLFPNAEVYVAKAESDFLAVAGTRRQSAGRRATVSAGMHKPLRRRTSRPASAHVNRTRPHGRCQAR